MAVTERQRGLDLEPGTSLGKYEVLRKLATGGMAEIYLARVRGTAGFEKMTVIKRILPHIAQDPQFVQMFLDEARLAATLQHPNIADVYDVGEHDRGEVFYAMEYVHGQDVRGLRWAARKRDEQIPLAISLAIIHGTASALDYAHDKRGPDGQPLGLVHRDISSSNIMISYDGAVKLLDFGIARATNQRQKTQTGTLKGKIPYMSPEQCRSGALDRRSDLFSLGTVMFEITTGRRPFRGQGDFDIMEQIVHHGAPRPSAIVNGYPLELEAIVMKLLAREREDRYQSAEDMLHDLDGFLGTHKLWASTKVVGKYMRQLFAERVEAWDSAREGNGIPVSLTPITGSARDLRTPSSAFSAVRLSQEKLAVPTDEELEALGNGDGPTVAMPELAVPAAFRATSAVDAIAEPSSVSRVSQLQAMPEAPRSNKRVLWIAGGGIALGAIGIVVVLLLSGGNRAESVAAPNEPAKPEPVKREPVKSESIAKPDPKPAEPAKPTTEKPAKPEPEPAVAATPTEPVKHARQPVTQKRPVNAKKDPPKDSKQDPVEKKEPPKDTAWDPNSPFLPPSN